MARTKKGKLIGAAAEAEKRDVQEYLEQVGDPNSLYWKNRLKRAFETIVSNPSYAEIWDSDLVPQHTTYKNHALLAEEIIRGKLKLNG